MFANRPHRQDFADTRTLGPEPVLHFLAANRFEPLDADEQLAQADAADRQLLRMVMGVAGLTLVLALLTGLA
jgi:hypothetical protein